MDVDRFFNHLSRGRMRVFEALRQKVKVVIYSLLII